MGKKMDIYVILETIKMAKKKEKARADHNPLPYTYNP